MSPSHDALAPFIPDAGRVVCRLGGSELVGKLIRSNAGKDKYTHSAHSNSLAQELLPLCLTLYIILSNVLSFCYMLYFCFHQVTSIHSYIDNQSYFFIQDCILAFFLAKYCIYSFELSSPLSFY